MRFKALDGWRGVCALLVAIYHFGLRSHVSELGLVKGSFLFVDFFFVLSGFVIMHAFGNRLTSVKDGVLFMIRRFGRLWPLHASILGLYILVGFAKLLVLHGSSLTAKYAPFSGQEDPLAIVPNLLMLHSMGLFDKLTWNAASWSISAEFWTYLVFTVVILASPRRGTFVASTIAVISLATLWVWSDSLMDTTFRFGFIRCLYGFFTGVLLQKLWVRYQGWRLNAATLLETLTVLAVIAFVSFYHDDLWAFASPLVFAATVFIFAFEQGVISRVLNARIPTNLGIWSYSIYMIHGLIIIQFNTLVSIGERTLNKVVSLERATAIRQVLENVWVQDVSALALLLVIVLAASCTYRWIEVPSRTFFNKKADALR